ncbi:MAG: hypothetical protein ABIK61_05220 [candidate division WOR-3 bacterium]
MRTRINTFITILMIVLIIIVIWLLITKILPQQKERQQLIEDFNRTSHIDFSVISNYSVV